MNKSCNKLNLSMISIIVPIYNVSKYLEDCLQSILSQDYNNIEVLCVDDGSTDSSANIVKKFEELDKRFKLLQQSNSGVSVARNLGLKYAKGEYICFVDADDMIAPNFLSVLYKFSKEGHFSVCSYTQDSVQLGSSPTKITRFTSRQFIDKIVNESIEHPNLWAMMFKSDIIKKYDIQFYPGCVRNEDTEFYMKYLVHENHEVILSDYKGYFYRDNPNSAMHVTKRNAFTSFEASERIVKYLATNGIMMKYNKMLFASIQAYSVNLARERNRELYDALHDIYDVSKVMRTLLGHPRILRRIVSLAYIVLGKKCFYSFCSMIGK